MAPIDKAAAKGATARTKKDASTAPDPAIVDRCRTIAERLAHLEAAAQGTRTIFGSSSHQWRRGSPLDAAALKKLETKLKGPLPDEARAWFSTVSSSGAGPFYGLLTPAVRKGSDPSAAFLATKKSGTSPFDGCLAVADEGCGMTSVLVLTGKNRGQVWSVSEGAARARQAPDFLSWIDFWWHRAAMEWCAATLFDDVVRGILPPVAAHLLPALESAVAEAGDDASEEALLSLCWMRAQAGDVDAAIELADRAAASFVNPNANQHDPNDCAKQDQERRARKTLYRARLWRVQGKRAEALNELATPLSHVHIWASTANELEAERVCWR